MASNMLKYGNVCKIVEKILQSNEQNESIISSRPSESNIQFVHSFHIHFWLTKNSQL